MNAAEIRMMTDDEILVKLDETYQEMFNLRFQYYAGELKNTNRLGEVRRDIARLKTILRERELQAAWAEESEYA